MTEPPDDSASTEASSTPPPDPASPPIIRARTGGWIGLWLVAVATLGVLALIGLTLAGRTARTPPVPLTALVTVLPYLYLLGGAGLFCLWVLLPDRRLIPALLSLVVVAGAAVWGPTLPSFSEETEGEALRVITWNVRRLWGGPGDGGDPRACVLEQLRAGKADLLSLQEVTSQDIAFFERELGVQCTQVDYLGVGDPRAGGVAGCVQPGRWTLRSGTSARFVSDRSWRYVMIEAESRESAEVINLLAVHLEPYRLAAGGLQHANSVRASQGDQSAELLRRVTRFQDPSVLAGDFNSTRDASLHVALRGLLRDAFERGGRGFGPTFYLFDLLPIRIDYTYVTERLAIRNAHVEPTDCSDHRPIVTDLVLRP